MSRLMMAATTALIVVACLSARAAFADEMTAEDADVNGDGIVNVADIGIVGNRADPRADANGDGIVTAVDNMIVVSFSAGGKMNRTPSVTPTPTKTHTPTPAGHRAITARNADVNDDGIVNVADIGIVGNRNDPRADANGDGIVTAVDNMIVVYFFGEQADGPVATPSVTATPTRTHTATPTAPTITPTPTRTNTAGAPTLTATATRTNTPVAPTPTRTSTPVAPTPTRTNTPVAPTPTHTSTPVAPTSTRTNTPVAPTPTRTSTPVAPTPTRTSTPVAPTPTRTSTPVAPTATLTNTPVAPTPTRTSAPVAPTPTNTPGASSGTRDKYLQPFSSTSPWNHPIGSGAQYVDANLPRTNYYHETELVYLDPSAPLRTLRDNGQWPATCGGGSAEGEVRIPNGVTISEGSDSYMPNNAAGALRADNNTIQEFLYASRCDGTGDIYTGLTLCSQSIYGSGVGPYCAHGGSGLSGVGGSLRVWEINSAEPIKHALKITMPSYLLSKCNGGQRWPAQNADSGYSDTGSWQYYAGAICDLRMGTLLAMPPNADCDTLVSAALARRICKALQDYGAYVVDVHPSWNTGCQCPRTDWRPMTLNGEAGTEAPTQAVGPQLLTLFENLDVIANNSASNPGGGGAPRVPLSPPIGN